MTKTEIQTAMRAAGYSLAQCESAKIRERCARLIEQSKIETFGHDGLMAVAAFRYSLGRMSYIVADTVDWLIFNWSIIPPSARKIIQRDLEEAFSRDDEAREFSAQYFPLGMDCDRQQWERVRALWMSPVSTDSRNI